MKKPDNDRSGCIPDCIGLGLGAANQRGRLGPAHKSDVQRTR